MWKLLLKSSAEYASWCEGTTTLQDFSTLAFSLKCDRLVLVSIVHYRLAGIFTDL